MTVSSSHRAALSHLMVVWPRLAAHSTDGFTQLDIIGMNGEMTTGTLPEGLWPLDYQYIFPTVADQCKISSSSTADDAGSTGATDVRIEGLDSNGDYLTEDIELDGTTLVPTVQSYLRINLMTVIAVGTGGRNDGLIKISHDTGDPILANIMVGHGVSMDGVYTVQNGCTLAISEFTLDLLKMGAGATRMKVEVYVRASGTDPWIHRAVLSVHDDASSSAEFEFFNGLILPAGCDLKMEVAFAASDYARARGRIHALLIDNDIL